MAGRHRKARAGMTTKQKNLVRATALAAPISAGLMVAAASGASASELQLPPLVAGQSQSATPIEQSTYPDWYRQINNQTLDSFGQQLQNNNPNRAEHVVVNGVDWGTDGCSGGGQSGQAACDRHDVNTRTLQQHYGYWNPDNYRNVVGSQFQHDLNTLAEQGTIVPGMKSIYSAGATELGSNVPGILPAWDPQSSWQTISPPPADLPDLTQYSNQQTMDQTLGQVAGVLGADGGSGADGGGGAGGYS